MDLKKTAEEWADIVLKKTKEVMLIRRSHVDEMKKNGFDSVVEGKKLLDYYEKLLGKL